METHGELMQIATIMYTNCTLASTPIINLPEANVSVSTRDQSFCQSLNTNTRPQDDFHFPPRTNYFSTVSIHSTNFTTYLLFVPSQSTTDVNVKIARRTKYPPLSLSLYFAPRKDENRSVNEVERCRHSLRGQIRALCEPRFSTRVHTTRPCPYTVNKFYPSAGVK